MKNFHIFVVHRKIRVLRGERGVHKKPLYREDCLKRGALTICRFKGGGLGQKENGGIFEGEGELIPQCTLC